MAMALSITPARVDKLTHVSSVILVNPDTLAYISASFCIVYCLDFHWNCECLESVHYQINIGYIKE